MVDRPDPGPKALPDRMQGGRSVLGRVIRKAERLLEIESELRRLLPEGLRHHVNVAGLDTGHLTLFVSSSARATQLRFQQHLISTQLAERTGEKILRIHVAVKPQAAPFPKNAPPEPRGIPMAAAAHFAAMARDEPDPALKKALERLAKRAQ